MRQLLLAFQAAKEQGAEVIYLGCEENMILAFVATASKTRSLSKEAVKDMASAVEEKK